MCDEWMPRLELPITIEAFRRMPRNAAYQYEYLEGKAWLNPRPRYYHALLDLPAVLEAPAETALRRLVPHDWEMLTEVFAAAFQRQQPFAGLTPAERCTAAASCLERTKTGGDGPLIEAASFVAFANGLAGAALVTLLPDGDPSDWDSYTWQEPPPPDCIERRLGRPHLTWIFVLPSAAGRGVGTALLTAVTAALVDLGYRQLASTFLLGNDASTLWHWRMGFRLLSYPGSSRRLTRGG